MKVYNSTLTNPIARRTLLKVTVEKKGNKFRQTTELGTALPNGTVRWTNYNKLRKNLSNADRMAFNAAITNLLLENK
jgi:hypothetical protein